MLQRAFEVRPRTIREELFPAPNKGWVQSGNIVNATPDSAEVLDNFFVTAQGARLRGGAQLYADIGATVVRLFRYSSAGTEDFWGSTASGVYDLARVNLETNNTATFADLEGMTSGDWSVAQLGNSAGQFLVAVNGAQHAMYWNGSNWFPITANNIDSIEFDAETSGFTEGETLTGGTSGATGTIELIRKSSPTVGTILFDGNTGVFQDNEALTDGAGGAATSASARTANVSTITITNVGTETLTHVNLHKRRLWFVEGGTMSAWYLPVDSIGGAAVEFDFGPVFKEGGQLLFTATWSLDSGDGLDDVFLAVTDQGEIAVYEGTDPSSGTTWSLAGVYKIGKVLDKHSYFKAGGDLVIISEDGLIPVSAAIQQDRAALQATALSYPIEDAWNEAIANRTTSYPITATLWQDQTLLLVGTPAKIDGVNIAFAANARTGAWSRVTGWDVRCSGIYADDLYFGNEDGEVLKADTGGTDNGTAYVGRYVPKFSYSQERRGAVTAGLTYKAREMVNFDLYAHADYQVDAMGTPVPVNISDAAAWGTGVWGTFVWGGSGELNSYTEWQQVRAFGYSLAPGLVIASNQTSLPEFEILATRLRSERGYPL